MFEALIVFEPIILPYSPVEPDITVPLIVFEPTILQK